jgi:hypothetical protein
VRSDPARTVEIVLPASNRRPPAVTAAIAALREAATALASTADAQRLGLRALQAA